ncbi:metabotropic glutamate receptor 1-like [Diadema antillarum]|uniref:metabotropic glutamate receptor 1-like n=1 Tax=Diadema antillarum TaxID=105358 RepID=UPI003A8C01E1
MLTAMMELWCACWPDAIRRSVVGFCVAVVVVSLVVPTALSASTVKRKVLRMDGDLIIGALFSVHNIPPKKEQATARRCGEIREQYGIHRVEVMLHTLEKINKDPAILPEVKLGCEIRDSCWYPSVALEQSLQFVSDNLETSSSTRDSRLECAVPDGLALDPGEIGLSAVAKRTSIERKPIAAVIGPGSSAVAIQVQNLLQLFNIPQVAYSATSRDLSDKTLFEYFLRVCPSDTLQAQAMVDIILRYNWTFVSAIHTLGNYGESGIQAFRAIADERGICIAVAKGIPLPATPADHDKVIDELEETPTAHVVVCFCEGGTVTALLQATRRKGKVGKYLFIGSDGWANRLEVVEGVEEEAVGGISLKPRTEHYRDFDPYWFGLNPENNTRNPWFREFWQEKFKCVLPADDAEPTESPPGRDGSDPPSNCTGEEALNELNYDQDTKMSFVVNAIYAVAYGLHYLQQKICGEGAVGLCPGMLPIDGRVLLDVLFNVSFLGVSGDHIKFDANGDPPGRYDIYSFQRLDDGQFGYVTVGDWQDGLLTMNDSMMMWNNGSTTMTRSYCSDPCPPHHAKDIRDNVECCWACVPCQENEYMLNEYTCVACHQGWWPTEELDDCYQIEAEYMKWYEGQAIAAVCFSCFGILLTVFVTVTFIRHNDTALVKASSRENSYILLAGIYMCFLVTFPYIAKPSTEVCYFRRIGLGLSFCICYAALVVRTNRMARILAGSKKKILTRKPRFLGGTAQVVMTFGVISIEVGIIVAMLILERPAAIYDYPALNQVRLICNTTTFGFVAPLGYDSLLVALCTLYAFKTRNLPENFNEAKYIAFTMYTTCVVWLAFIPLYFGSELKEIVVCFAVSLSATVTLACLFFPKTYIILLKPERNRRSSMTTSNLVRMHVGSFSELAPNRSNSSSNGTTDGCNEKLLGSDRQGHALKSGRKKQPSSTSSSAAREKSREKNREKVTSFGNSGFFSALRRRKRPMNTKHMKAVQRDRLLSKRKQPVYRYGNSSTPLPSQPSPVEEADSSAERSMGEHTTRAEEASRAMGCLKPSRTVSRVETYSPHSSVNVDIEAPAAGCSGSQGRGQKSIIKPSQSVARTQNIDEHSSLQLSRIPSNSSASVSLGAKSATRQRNDSKPQACVLPLRVRRSHSDETIHKKTSPGPSSSSKNSGSDSRFLGVERPQRAAGSYNQIYPDLLQVLPTAEAQDSSAAYRCRGSASETDQELGDIDGQIPTGGDQRSSRTTDTAREGVKRSVRFDERTISSDNPTASTKNITVARWGDGDHVVSIPNEILGVLTTIKSSDV